MCITWNSHRHQENKKEPQWGAGSEEGAVETEIVGDRYYEERNGKGCFVRIERKEEK